MAGKWNRKTLADVCAPPQYGAIAKGGNEYGGPLFVRQTDIVSGRVDWSSVPRCDLAAADAPKYTVHEGDLLISRLGAGVGNAAVVDNTNGAVFAGYLVRFRPNPQVAEARFVGYHLQSRAWRDHVHGFRSGAAQPTLNAQQMGAFEFDLPPLAEQREIASILGALDDKIELNRKMNATLEAMARVLFRSWFVDFDPVRAKAAGREPSGMDAETAKLFPREFVESELGYIPKGWSVGTVADCGDVITGKTPSKAESANFGVQYPFIKIPDMHGQLWISDTQDGLSELGHRSQPNKLVPPRSIAVSCIATVGLVSLVRFPSHTNQQINTVVPKVQSSWPWLLYAMRDLAPQLEARAAGGSVTKNLNKGQFETIPLVLPGDAVTAAFERNVKSLLDMAMQRHDEVTRLESLRDELLPQLLSRSVDIGPLVDGEEEL